jgi:hypothetical protein
MPVIKQSVIDLIQQRYHIVDIVDLSEHVIEPESLAVCLSQHINAKFDSNQRIVVLQHDTDYYPRINSVGNTLYNFVRLCANYQIPLDKVILLTNNYGVEAEIQSLARQICNEDTITVIYTAQWFDFPDMPLQPHSPEVPIKNLYCCLNGKMRQHRILTLSMLQEHQLLDLGVISYHFGDS